ncbi:MAG TPA: MATE family efflux transporter, partial [Acidobacteriota bacterium]
GVLAIAISTIMIVFSKEIISIFTTDYFTIELGQKAIYIFALAQIPKSLNSVVSGNLRGAGELKWLMWMTILFVGAFEIGLNWIAAFIFGWGLYGIWAVQTADETIRIGLNYWRFGDGRWKVSLSNDQGISNV